MTLYIILLLILLPYSQAKCDFWLNCDDEIDMTITITPGNSIIMYPNKYTNASNGYYIFTFTSNFTFQIYFTNNVGRIIDQYIGSSLTFNSDKTFFGMFIKNVVTTDNVIRIIGIEKSYSLCLYITVFFTCLILILILYLIYQKIYNNLCVTKISLRPSSSSYYSIYHKLCGRYNEMTHV